MRVDRVNRVNIIGGGPVGCYLGALAAKKSGDAKAAKVEVTIFEEHSEIGEPNHCTGIVTDEIFNYIPSNSRFVVNKINEFHIYSPNGKFIDIPLKKSDVILDRVKFDEYFADKAVVAGAELKRAHRFLGIESDAILVRDLARKKTVRVPSSGAEGDFIIGADGPQSPVGKAAGILKEGKQSREYFIGVQAVVKKKNENAVDFHPLASGFGWAVPEDERTMRVGVAVREDARAAFEWMLKKYPGRIVSKQGGLIPIYDPAQKVTVMSRAGKVILVGDSAGFVKATSGGGLVSGLLSAELAAQSVCFGKNYPFAVKRKIMPGLLMHKILRSKMDHLSTSDWNSIIAKLGDDSAKKILANNNRDNIISLAAKLAIRKPSLMKYAFR